MFPSTYSVPGSIPAARAQGALCHLLLSLTPTGPESTVGGLKAELSQETVLRAGYYPGVWVTPHFQDLSSH